MHFRSRLLLIPALCLPLALVAAGCGGDDDDDSGSSLDRATVEPTRAASPAAERSATPTGSAATPAGSPTAAASAAPRTPTTAPLRFAAADKVIDAAAKDYTATITTAKGEITLKLFDDLSPNTVNVFVFLAQKKYFDNISFHRVVADFVVQGGDPTGTGGGGPGFETEQEANEFKNLQGYVSMARASGSTKFGSQFFINLKDNPSLDQDAPNQKRFYPFGQVTKGMDVVNQIKQGDKIQSVAIVETPQGQ